MLFRSLGQVWQNVAFTRDISWAVRKGYLVQPIGVRLEIDPADLGNGDRSVVDRWTGSADTLDKQLTDGIAPARVVEEWIKAHAEAKGRYADPEWMPTILFAPLVRSANAFRDAFRKEGVVAETVHGDMPKAERRRVIADFKAGKIEVLCNAMVLTAGFDQIGRASCRERV